jgi:hypothetical protein
MKKSIALLVTSFSLLLAGSSLTPSIANASKSNIVHTENTTEANHQVSDITKVYLNKDGKKIGTTDGIDGPTINSDGSSTAYSMKGIPARIANPKTIMIYISPNITHAEQKTLIGVCQTWSNDTGFTFLRTDDEDKAQITYTNEKPGNPKADAETTNYYQMNEDGNFYNIVKSKISIDLPAPDWYDSYMVRTFMHETGHALGLDDTYDKVYANTSIMYGYMTDENGANYFEPQEYDINNIKALYNIN